MGGGVLGGGTGNVVVINEISTEGAADVLGIEALGLVAVPASSGSVGRRPMSTHCSLLETAADEGPMPLAVHTLLGVQSKRDKEGADG
jgi:hypothetical protein